MTHAGAIVLHRHKAKPFWCGHPLVFSGAVAREEGAPQCGQLVTVLDHDGRAIGIGAYNPHSQYRVRLLAWAGEKTADETLGALIMRRIRDARAVRAALALPSAHTSAYRLLNSEGDRCSGLTVDCFHDAGDPSQCTVAVASAACWTEVRRAEICGAIQDALAPARICWRQSRAALALDGWTLFTDETHAAPRVIVSEHGVRYVTEPGGGQKTGFYCDQRENRLLVRQLARGRRVLDAYCYTGGFALNAAAGGAISVHAVDSSEPALALARENAALNPSTLITFEHADVRAVLARAGSYDLMVLDPPKLAGTRSQVPRAVKLYRALCADALRRLTPQGLLLVCSCSSAIGAEELAHALRDAGMDAARAVSILSITHAAPDHPVPSAFPEGQYLTAVLAVAL